MSADVMEMLARRWHCSVQDVRERLAERVIKAGLAVPGKAVAYEGQPYQNVLQLGVTDDDRIAVLDADDKVLLWLT